MTYAEAAIQRDALRQGSRPPAETKRKTLTWLERFGALRDEHDKALLAQVELEITRDEMIAQVQIVEHDDEADKERARIALAFGRPDR